MYKYPGICKIFCVIMVLLFFFTGCKEEPPKPPPQPKVIRKKISARPPKAETTIAAAETEDKDSRQPDMDKPEIDKKETITPVPEKTKPDKKSETADPAKKTDPLKSDPEKSETEIASISDISSNNESDKYIAYNPKGKIDPFAPLFKEDAKEDKKKEPEEDEPGKPKTPPRPLTPLEKLDLGQLKLVGIISAESGNKALVEEASGKGYIIIKGTYIGIHSGKVVDILKDRIIVEEEDKDMLGQITIRKRELKFQRPAGDDYYEM